MTGINKHSIDLKELMRICNGDFKFYVEMLRIFNISLESGFKSIDDCLGQNKVKMISDYAHKMKSPVRHLNVVELYNSLNEIEELSRIESPVEKVRKLVEAAKIEAGKIENEVKIEIDRVKKVHNLD